MAFGGCKGWKSSQVPSFARGWIALAGVESVLA